jgi:hypothetical protein
MLRTLRRMAEETAVLLDEFVPLTADAEETP